MKATYKVIQDEIVLDKWSDEVTLYFFGDVHRDTPNCDVERWQWFLKKAKASMDKNTYFIGMGDYHDFASTKEKKYLDSGIHKSTRNKFDEMAEADNRKFASECSFMKGHLLGLIEGNHSWVFATGKTSGEDLAERLGSKDLGWLCHYTILFKYKNRSTVTTAVHFVLCHGKAGGKTHGITVNQVADLKQIFPVADVYCVSQDTEILTLNGWKKYHEIKIGEPVYSYNVETDVIEEDEIKEIVCYPHDGKVIRIDNKNTDQVMIPQHRVYYKHKKGKYLVNTAEHLKNIHAQIQLPLSGNIRYGYDKFYDDFCSLTGWLISEGHFKGSEGDHGKGILIYQKHKDKAELIRSILQRLDIHFTERINTEGLTVFYIKTESAVYIRNHIDNKERLPRWIYELSERQFDLFWDAFVMDDGNRISKTAGTAYSASKDLMDNLQHALVLHGYRSNYKFKKGGFKDGGWVMNWCKKLTTEFNTKRTIKEADYNGIVWCVSTKNNTFIARRNRKPFITGNCMGHDHQRVAHPVSILVPVKGQGGFMIKQKRQFLCRSGSFMKGYMDGSNSYEIFKLYKPNDLGALKMTIAFHNGDDRTITDIHAEI